MEMKNKGSVRVRDPEKNKGSVRVKDPEKQTR